MRQPLKGRTGIGPHGLGDARQVGRAQRAPALERQSCGRSQRYAAGELKHGPIALIDETVPVIVIAPEDDLFDKTISNLQEVAARGGQIILVSNAEAGKAACKLHAHVPMPDVHPFTNPLIYALPMQLMAYHTAVFMGTDIDQPRNLAKSVTVE